MRPIPQTILIVFLLALCGLSVVQWQREAEIRRIAVAQRNDIVSYQLDIQEGETRMKAADAEILRLTGSLNELRTTSVSKQDFEEQAKVNTEMKAALEKQNEMIRLQNEAVQKQNDAIQQQNELMKKLVIERDELVSKFNDLTARYNKLANPAAASN